MADKISITICGDGGCGKSSITLRLVRSEWIHEYDPTIEDSYSVTRTIDGLPYFLSITDTAGQEEYRGLWTTSNLKSDAFLLVYDITSASSLGALDEFMELIDMEADTRLEDNDRLRRQLGDSADGLEVGMPPPIKIVAGNKCDLKEARVIGAREGLEYARKHGCGFMETSAREMVNIEETFALLVRRVVEARRLHYQRDRPGPHSKTAGASAAQTAGPRATGNGQDAQSSRNAHKRPSRLMGFLKGSRRRTAKSKEMEESTKQDWQDSSGVEKEEESRKGFWRRIRCW